MTVQATQPPPRRTAAEALAAIAAEERRLTRELAAVEADLDRESVDFFTRPRPRLDREQGLRARRAELLDAQDRAERARRLLTKEEEMP